MNKQALPLLIGLSFCGVALAQSSPAAAPSTNPVTLSRLNVQGALSEDAIKSSIALAGFKEVKGLKFKDGVWRSEARGGNKQWVKIAVGPQTGKVYVDKAPSKLNQNEIKAKLAAAGYQNVSDVRYELGLWEAIAGDSGAQVRLLVDPDDGSVVAHTPY